MRDERRDGRLASSVRDGSRQFLGAGVVGAPRRCFIHPAIAAAAAACVGGAGRAAFGDDLSGQQSDAVYAALVDLLNAIVSSVLTLVAFIPGWRLLPTATNRMINDQEDRMR